MGRKTFTQTLIFSFLIFTAVFLFAPAPPAQAAPPANFQTTLLVGSGLVEPTALEIAPDGRTFILYKSGIVKIYKNGQLINKPFVTLSVISSGQDRGLLGIALDPDYNTNKYLYLYYNGANSRVRVDRFTATTDVASGQVKIYEANFDSPGHHVGGTIRFGNDKKLYISVGDNGTPLNSQSLANPFGKILRINKDGTIPADNPFAGLAGKSPEIWAYGLRNPFRFTVDQVSGRIFVGDVGQATWEEMNLLAKGANYGWPTCEGSCTTAGMTNPIYSYNHNGGSASITAGPVYQGSMFPQTFKGSLFFADYALGFIKRLTLDSNGKMTAVSNFDPTAGTVVDLKVHPDGSMYYLTIYPSKLYRISYATSNQPPIAKASADKTSGFSPLTVNFSSAGSSDPEGQPLKFTWNFGDGTSSTQANPQKIFNSNGTYTVQLTVSDGTNNSQAQPLTIRVGTPPTLTISTPTEGSKYNAGQTISYSSSAKDSSGNNLPDSAFKTEVIFHHDQHIHPFLGPIQSRTGQFTIPKSGHPETNVWFEIKITAKDSNNLSTTKSVNIFPNKVNLTFATSPSNLQILLDGSPTTTPQTIEHVVGYERLIDAPNQSLNAKTYQFKSWSDGGLKSHTISAPATATTYTAVFEETTSPGGGTGLSATYFNNSDFTGTSITRVDPTIDFNWAKGSPDPTIEADTFSVRWTGFIVPQYTGMYWFYTITDDGVRLWVNNQLLMDKWFIQNPTEFTAKTPLTAGVKYPITMEYFENALNAVSQLRWASYDQPKQIIPQNRLFPE